MSKKENITETPVQEDKIVTRYDRRMEKRKKQAEEDKKEQRRFRIIGIVMLAVVVCVIAYFPIRNYINANKTFIVIDEEQISRTEFDYYYGTAVNNYYNQNSSILAYAGVDFTADLSNQMYSEYLSWHDFFQQMAVESIIETKVLLEEAKKEGFTYDTTEDLKAFREDIKEQASINGMNVSAFTKLSYGSYATLDKIESYLTDNIIANAYYQELGDRNVPSDDEITAYYNENPDEYDCVDYRKIQIDAQLPTEPTELADPVEEDAEDAEAEDTEAEDTEEEEYVPSDAEKEAAMAEAKKEAEKAEKTVATKGELVEGEQMLYSNVHYRDWLFDPERKAGDTTIVEDPYSSRYYVLAFEKRYIDETATANLRVIVTEEDPQVVLDEWKSGAATEDSFIELVGKYGMNAEVVPDGLYEEVTKDSLETELADWIYAKDRAVGDTTAISIEEGDNYVLYYLGQGEAEWKLSIKYTLMQMALEEYVSALKEDVEILDPDENVDYIEILEIVEEMKKAQQEEAENAESSSTQDSSEAE